MKWTDESEQRDATAERNNDGPWSKKLKKAAFFGLKETKSSKRR